MAQYRIDPEQKAALDAINGGLDSVRILNRLVLAEGDICVSVCESGKKRKRGDSETAIIVDASQKDRIISVLTVQRAKAIREITALAKKHDIELDEDEKAVISVNAISQLPDKTREQSLNKEIPA